MGDGRQPREAGQLTRPTDDGRTPTVSVIQLARSRRMTRSFDDRPVGQGVVDAFVDAARLAPVAGNSTTPEFLVLAGSSEVGSYWDVTLAADQRDGFAWPGLLLAPVLVLIFVEPEAYLRRYSEPDKLRAGLGDSLDAWSTPYWWVDGGMAAMTILLAVEEAGLGALFFGLFEHEEAVKKRFGVPSGRRGAGVIALGHRAADQRPSSSAERGRRSLREVTHRSRWDSTG
ncbi:MAG: nitroreductase family protein [Acidimicrobiales bacterium]